ncbi:MAG: NERD domain-containing protein [Pseudomonadota bacterium]
MILKEKQLTNSQDVKIRAGEEAEKQMAFYLKRAFGKNNDCYVLNDLRIVYGEDTAQIDHLIITPFGLFIIESKSVHGRIIVNKRNEWSRTYNKRVEGMSSPILQAKAQGKVLRELLMENKETLLGKALFGSVQKGFVNCKIFIYAAISDNGMIDREHDVKELFKADQICESIATELDLLKKRNRLLSSNPVWEINLAETKIVADFLLRNHKPLLNRDITKTATSLAESKATPSLSQNNPEKSFVPKVGAICPQCNQLKLVRKSIQRADGTETDFLACSGYPKQCKAIFALVALTKKINETNNIVDGIQKYKENDDCPICKSGKLKVKINKAKRTEFIGCSEFPKCRFNY